MISQTTIAQVKENTRRIAERLRLDKWSSGRSYDMACCPFHDDANPSMAIYDDGYHCFSCSAHGDIIALVQRVRGIATFPEAVREAAEIAGIPVHEEQSEVEKRLKALQDEWRAVVENARKNFPGSPAEAYLRQRYGDEMAEKVAAWGGGLGCHDERLLIPFSGKGDRLNGYALRRLDGGKPKYLTARGAKRHLFGLQQALEMDTSGAFVIVEGYFDAIALQIHGYPAVSVMGTSITQPDALRLAETKRPVVLMMDGDEAGKNARRKITADLWRAGCQDVRVAILPADKDPDEILVDELETMIATAPPVTSILIGWVQGAGDAKERMRRVSVAANFAAAMPTVVLEAFLRNLATAAGVPLDVVRTIMQGSNTPQKPPEAIQRLPVRSYTAADYAAALLAFNPEDFHGIFSELALEDRGAVVTEVAKSATVAAAVKVYDVFMRSPASWEFPIALAEALTEDEWNALAKIIPEGGDANRKKNVIFSAVLRSSSNPRVRGFAKQKMIEVMRKEYNK